MTSERQEGMNEPANGSDDGNGAVAHRLQPDQAAGLEAAGNHEVVRACDVSR